MGLDKKQGLLLLAAAAGLAAIVVVGIIVIVALRSGSSPADGSPGAGLTSEAGARTAAERRLVLEEWTSDDAARTEAFRRLLKDEGNPCSGVEKAAMVAPGVWTVRCAPGYVYRLKFSQKAKLVEVTKLQ